MSSLYVTLSKKVAMQGPDLLAHPMYIHYIHINIHIFLSDQCISRGHLGFSFDIGRYCCIYLCVYVMFNTFFIVLCIKSTFICVFLNSLVICLTSLPQYVKVAHSVMWYLESGYMFCFYGCAFSIRFVLYFLS
jgi:hypothetical protein